MLINPSPTTPLATRVSGRAAGRAGRAGQGWAPAAPAHLPSPAAAAQPGPRSPQPRHAVALALQGIAKIRPGTAAVSLLLHGQGKHQGCWGQSQLLVGSRGAAAVPQ